MWHSFQSLYRSFWNLTNSSLPNNSIPVQMEMCCNQGRYGDPSLKRKEKETTVQSKRLRGAKKETSEGDVASWRSMQNCRSRLCNQIYWEIGDLLLFNPLDQHVSSKVTSGFWLIHYESANSAMVNSKCPKSTLIVLVLNVWELTWTSEAGCCDGQFWWRCININDNINKKYNMMK